MIEGQDYFTTPNLTGEQLSRATAILGGLITAGIVSRRQPPKSIDFVFVTVGP